MQHFFGSYVMFSIDNVHDLHTVAKFTRFMDMLRAMGKLSGNMQLNIGCYEGKLEYSFLCSKEDFVAHVSSSGYVDHQNSFLHIEGDDMKAILEYNDCTQRKECIGRLVAVDAPEAMQQKGWTYNQERDVYYIVKA